MRESIRMASKRIVTKKSLREGGIHCGSVKQTPEGPRIGLTLYEGLFHHLELPLQVEAAGLLVKVRQIGDAACHTGFRSCFYRVVKGDELLIDGEKIFDPEKVYGERE